VSTNGTDFSVLHNFSSGALSGSVLTNLDGIAPHGTLVLAGGMLYGVAAEGGAYGAGTVFEMEPDGEGFRVLKSFHPSGAEGDYPVGLASYQNSLFGATARGGDLNEGVVFQINVAPAQAIPLAIELRSGQPVLTWENPLFILQASTQAAGPYTNWTDAASPLTNAPGDAPLFFRLQAGE
jgi:uncharacterized repeat protein (TIGR03803 family)